MRLKWSELTLSVTLQYLILFIHLVVKFDLVGKGVSESPDAVSNESLQICLQELIQVTFQVRLGRLRPGADGHGSAVVRVG